jgi:hypothetical protein
VCVCACVCARARACVHACVRCSKPGTGTNSEGVGLRHTYGWWCRCNVRVAVADGL